jgi:hypothetical protein
MEACFVFRHVIRVEQGLFGNQILMRRIILAP